MTDARQGPYHDTPTREAPRVGFTEQYYGTSLEEASTGLDKVEDVAFKADQQLRKSQRTK